MFDLATDPCEQHSLCSSEPPANGIVERGTRGPLQARARLLPLR